MELYSRRLRRTLLLYRSESGRVHAMAFVGHRREEDAPIVNAMAVTGEDIALHPPSNGFAGWLQIGTAMFGLEPSEFDAMTGWLKERNPPPPPYRRPEANDR